MAKKTNKTKETKEIKSQEELNNELNKKLSSLISIFKAVNPNIGGIQIFLNKANNKWNAVPMYFDPEDANKNTDTSSDINDNTPSE